MRWFRTLALALALQVALSAKASWTPPTDIEPFRSVTAGPLRQGQSGMHIN